ncbi:MAG: homoserine dehydrogenase [Kordiimonadaceae bacterium]|nr:homoserine dehydrogenase [Kordiimonadaceae bacterium]
MKHVKTAMLGLGNVHKNLISILEEKRASLGAQYGLEFKIIAISDSSGIAVNEDGFDMAAVLDHKRNGGRVSGLKGYQGTRQQHILNELPLDLIFEATPVDLKTGGEALDICRSALIRGVSVVLANKGPVVQALAELEGLAKKSGAGIGYSATVCGGLPVLNIARRDMVCGDIRKLSGVFNGTSNFIFDALARGMSFDEALLEAQNVGAAEADPTLDIGGWDTAFKLLIIANSVLGANISLDNIEVEGIEEITDEMLIKEKERGNTIKLVANAEEGRFTVKPVLLPIDSFLGSCNGWEMGVEIHSDIYGIMYHKLYEKEPIPTAASMMRDAVNIFRNR